MSEGEWMWRRNVGPHLWTDRCPMDPPCLTLAEAVAEAHAAGVEEGRRLEREDVVAWLRRPGCLEPTGAATSFTSNLTGAIARGEHDKFGEDD